MNMYASAHFEIDWIFKKLALKIQESDDSKMTDKKTPGLFPYRNIKYTTRDRPE